MRGIRMVRFRRGRGVGRGRRRLRRGRGKAWDWIKGAAGKVNNFFKSSKILSKVAPAVMGAIPGASQYSGIASSALNQLGYGRRRRRFSRRRMFGGKGKGSRMRRNLARAHLQRVVNVKSHSRRKPIRKVRTFRRLRQIAIE